MFVSIPESHWLHRHSHATTIVDDHTADILSQQFCNLPIWKKFSSKKFRQLQDSHSYRTKITASKPRLRLFWNASMLLQARTVWCKALNHKLPTLSSLQKIRLVDTT
ncbi:hypothetical protein G6F47_012196 [Rhizopus delemar]|nr:hypothetical protein G6F48_012443 [Rhizopus delemar]KAG1582535.1 hypothetical protein G6F47_012196 [Rhizopus delemar]KAG1626506.1 hypothetical protein G6F44_012424 [Rhizopus delemar]